MFRKSLAVLLLLLPAVPALAKSDPDYYPMSCDVLWTAVKSILNKPSDYAILASDDLSRKAQFIVVGDLAVFKDIVVLKSQDNGCSLKLKIIQIGPDNSNERGFRGRLKRTLAKMQRAQQPSAIGGVPTVSSAAAPAQPLAVPAAGAPAKPQTTPRTVAEGIWPSTLVSQIPINPVALTPDTTRPAVKPVRAIPHPDGAGL